MVKIQKKKQIKVPMNLFEEYIENVQKSSFVADQQKKISKLNTKIKDIKKKIEQIQTKIETDATSDEVLIQEFQKIMKIPKKNKETIGYFDHRFGRTDPYDPILPSKYLFPEDQILTQDDINYNEIFLDMDKKLRKICQKYPKERVALIFDNLEEQDAAEGYFYLNKEPQVAGLGVIDCGKIDEQFNGNNFYPELDDTDQVEYVLFANKEYLDRDIFE